MHKTPPPPLTFHLKLRRSCRHAVWLLSPKWNARCAVPLTVAPLAFGVLQPIRTANKSDPLIDPLLSLRLSVTTQMYREDLVSPGRGHWAEPAQRWQLSPSGSGSEAHWLCCHPDRLQRSWLNNWGGAGILSQDAYTRLGTFFCLSWRCWCLQQWNGAICWAVLFMEEI